MGTTECYYALLGLPTDASQREIQRAWRQKALLYHPDKVAEEDKAAAEERFKEVSQANEVISDPEQRRLYDAYGPSLQPPKPTWQDGMSFRGQGGGGDEFEAELLEALFQAMGAQNRRPPKRTEADVWDGTLGL